MADDVIWTLDADGEGTLSTIDDIDQALAALADSMAQVGESGADVGGLDESLSMISEQSAQAAEAASGLSESIAQMAEEAGSAGASVQELGTALDEAASQAEAGMSGAASAAEEASANMDASLSDVVSAIQSLQGSFQELAATIASTSSEAESNLAQVGEAAQQASEETQEAGESGGSGFMAGMGQVGMALFAIQNATNMASQAFQQATGPFGNFQEQLTQLVTGAGESEKNLGMVSSSLEQMSVQTGTSTDQLTAGMYEIDSAGYTVANGGLKVLLAAVEGAKVGASDLGTVADAETTMLKNYGQSGSQAASDVNQLIATVAAGKMHMTDLANSLAAVLPVAAKAGLSYAQVGGAIATMTAMGTPAQQATQDLANTIRALQSPNQTAINEMQQMGLNSNQVAMQLGKKGLTGTLEELTQAITAHMGPAGTVLMNTFNSSKVAASDADQMIKAMPDSLQQLAQSYLNGSVTAKQWRTDLQGLDPVQQHLMQQFAATADKAHSFNSLLTSGSPAAQTYTAALSKMLGGSTGLNTALQLTGTNMTTFQQNVDKIATAAKHGGDSITGWSLVQQDFNFKMSQAAQSANVFMINLGQKLAPVILSVMSDIGKASGFVEKYHTAFLIAAGALTAFFIPALIKTGVEAAAAGIKVAASFVKSIVMAGVEGYQAAGKLAVMIGQYIATGAQAVIAGAKIAAQFVVSIIRSGIEAVVAGAKMVASLVPAIISVVTEGIVAAATAIPGLIVGFIGWAGAALGAAAATIAATWPILLIIVGIAALIAVIILLVTHWRQVTEFLKSAWQATVSWLEGAFHAVAAFVSSIWQHIVGVFHAAVAAVIGFVRSHWQLLVSIIGGPIVAIVLLIITHWKQIEQFLAEAWAWVKQTATQLWDDVTGIFRDAWSGLSNAISSLWRNIESLVSSWPGKALQWGKDLIQNLINGITSMIGNVGSAVGSIAGKIASFLHFTKPDEGPLAQADRFMPDFIELLMQGLSSGTSRLASTASAAAGQIAASFAPRSIGQPSGAGGAPIGGSSTNMLLAQMLGALQSRPPTGGQVTPSVTQYNTNNLYGNQTLADLYRSMNEMAGYSNEMGLRGAF